MKEKPCRVGELRPSQLLFTYGIGAIVDLPNISVMVLGLDDWDEARARAIPEQRLLEAVRRFLPQVQTLRCPPYVDVKKLGPLDEDASLIGVPVAPFPRWMVCPACRRLAPLSNGMFELKTDMYRMDRIRYVHTHCQVSRSGPTVFPARFLLACKNGHLDDFPWAFFVHRGELACPGPFRLDETGPSGEARDIRVSCEKCRVERRMTEAFGEEGRKNLPRCRGRRVHLKDEEPEPCQEPPRAMLMGASNLWFPVTLPALSIPVSANRLAQTIDELWIGQLEHVVSSEVLNAFLKLPQYHKLAEFKSEEVWEAVKQRKEEVSAPPAPTDLKRPEWEILADPRNAPSSDDFHLVEVPPPEGFEQRIQQVVLADRLREVQALTGFTRIESSGEAQEEEQNARLVPLSRQKLRWVPATEVRGEGIFIRLRDDAIEEWLSKKKGLSERTVQFATSFAKWRQYRKLPPRPFPPGMMRYILLHSLSHALIRQLSLECGYSAASIRERIYSRDPNEEGGPMAGILLYTAAPDSEGTLGGLVMLGEPEELGRHLRSALREASICANDPLCSEHSPSQDGRTLHGATCHGCLLIAETSCEHGNRFLDRSLLTDTVSAAGLSFFS